MYPKKKNKNIKILSNIEVSKRRITYPKWTI